MDFSCMEFDEWLVSEEGKECCEPPEANTAQIDKLLKAYRLGVDKGINRERARITKNITEFIERR